MHSSVSGFLATDTVSPFALDPGQEAAMALGSGMNQYQVAWPFMVVSIGDLDEFVGKWAGWFAEACQSVCRPGLVTGFS